MCSEKWLKALRTNRFCFTVNCFHTLSCFKLLLFRFGDKIALHLPTAVKRAKVKTSIILFYFLFIFVFISPAQIFPHSFSVIYFFIKLQKKKKKNLKKKNLKKVRKMNSSRSLLKLAFSHPWNALLSFLSLFLSLKQCRNNAFCAAGR